MPTLVRRTVAGIAAGALLAGAAVLGTAGTAQAKPHKPDKPHTLRHAAAKQDRFVGVAVADHRLADDQYAGLVEREFSSVTPENVMKWEAIEPARGEFDFAAGDRLVDFAEENDQLVYGHTLVWHSQTPAWLSDGDFSARELRQITRSHISSVVGHYRGDVQRWDVVNEALNEDGTLRNTMWLETLGEDYIADAFRTAHRADPRAKLFINDYNTDGINAKSDGMYELVRGLLAEGVPIHGVGFQSHMILGQVPETYEENLQRFADLGLEVVITEVDIRMQMPADDAKLAQQAEDYRQVTEACVNVRRCAGITFWGLGDGDSWVPGWFEGEGAPLLFDEDYRRKPAYYAVLDTLRDTRPCDWHTRAI